MYCNYSYCCVNSFYKVIMARGGALPALIALSMSGDREREAHSCAALANIAEMVEGRTQERMIEEVSSNSNSNNIIVIWYLLWYYIYCYIVLWYLLWYDLLYLILLYNIIYCIYCIWYDIILFIVYYIWYLIYIYICIYYRESWSRWWD